MSERFGDCFWAGVAAGLIRGIQFGARGVGLGDFLVGDDDCASVVDHAAVAAPGVGAYWEAGADGFHDGEAPAFAQAG